MFFGRAGHLGSAYAYTDSVALFGEKGHEWSSVASSSINAYFILFEATGVGPSLSNSYTYPFPLRCLVNSPVGGGGRGLTKIKKCKRYTVSLLFPAIPLHTILFEKVRSYGEDERVSPATAGADDALLKKYDMWVLLSIEKKKVW